MWRPSGGTSDAELSKVFLEAKNGLVRFNVQPSIEIGSTALA